MNCADQVSIVFIFSRLVSRFHSVKQCESTEKVKTEASFCSLNAATATSFVLLCSGVIAIFALFEIQVSKGLMYCTDFLTAVFSLV